MESLYSHFNNWIAVMIFIVFYSSIVFFLPYYKKLNYKPKGAYLAFVIAFAVEMHGIPFSMYLISLIIGKKLSNGILWGHTLFDSIGYTGMYINIFLTLTGILIIANGWYNIYHQYWKKINSRQVLVKSGIYKYIRHPQYLGLFLISTGMLIEWITLPLLIIYPIIIRMYYKLAKKEEKDMIEQFGDEYIEYSRDTKMFIPIIF